MTRTRLDVELVRRGLATSRNQAQELIDQGRILVSSMVATKPATQVDTGVAIEIKADVNQIDYVSRGAYKLLGALDAFSGLFPPIDGAKCLDAGASTGGFTDVLLRRGAAEVTCVDVGYGQLAWKLRDDPRVRVLERMNIRHLTPEILGEPPSIVVGDLSFISLTLVLPALVKCCPGATMMLMVKPQFEAGKDRVGVGGVVRDISVREDAVIKVAECAIGLGLEVRGVAASPLPGPAGNVEYFLLLVPGRQDTDLPVEMELNAGGVPTGASLAGSALIEAVKRAVAEGPQNSGKPDGVRQEGADAKTGRKGSQE